MRSSHHYNDANASTKLNQEACKAVEVALNYNKDLKKIDKDLENLFNLINTLVTNPLSRSSLVLHIVSNDVLIAGELYVALCRQKRDSNI